MSEMSNNNFKDNGVNGTGTDSEGASPGRCPSVRQRGPGRHPATVRTKWSKEINKLVMECFYRSKPFDIDGKPIRGYRQRMMHEWRERGRFDITEQRLCDQARAIRKNEWLSELELENIKRMINGDIDKNGNEEDEETEAEGSENVRSEINVQNNNILHESDINISIQNIETLDEEERHIISRIQEILTEGRDTSGISFKKVDYKRLNKIVESVNKAINYVETTTITQTNNLIKAASVWVADQIGLKPFKGGKKNVPWWKRRIEADIKQLRKDVNFLGRIKRNEVNDSRKGKVKTVMEKYRVDRKGLTTVIEELKQRILAKAAKITRYDQRIEQYRINRLFDIDQKKVYNELNGQTSKNSDEHIPDANESKRFWSDIWSVEKEHNKEAGWLKEMKRRDIVNERQGNVLIDETKVKSQCKKMPNWKAPGHDGVQGFWIKKLNNLHRRIASQLNEMIEGNEIPSWMTYGRTILCQKDAAKGNAVDNYRPISCLPLMWKLTTGIISQEMYCYLESEKLLPEEQKGCRRKSRGTKDQLLIDKTILKDCKRRKTNLSMAWIDYRKAYDLVPHSWILECLDICGIAENIIKFVKESMKDWKLLLTSNGTDLCEVDVNRGIFQGDSLSPLLFVVCMIPLSLLLRKVNASYEWSKGTFKINHLLFMDDLKLFGKNENQIDSLVQTVYIFSQDIGMEFGLKKCAVIVMKKGKMVRFDGIQLPNEEVMKSIDEKGYTYLGVIEMDEIKEQEMKKIVITEYKRRLRLVLRSKLNGKNKIKAINTWAVALLRYGAGIINWKVEELKSLDRTTRKTLTMYGALHPKSDVDRLYVKRKEGGRGLINIEGCVKSEENNLGLYVRDSEEDLLKGVKIVGIIETENIMEKEEFKSNLQRTTKMKWHGKKMYGQFSREMKEEIDKGLTWKWVIQSDLKVQTEALIFAAQEQALRTNYIKHNIDKTAESPLCRMCREKGETVQHLICECSKLAQREYKRRHDNIAKLIHWKLCGEHKFVRKEKWYEHCPEGVVENEQIKLIWDMNIQCDNVIEARRPDLILIRKEEKTCIIIDVAVPGDSRVNEKEIEKIEKYQDLKRELIRIWKLKKVQVVPVVVGALGCISKKFEKWMETLEINVGVSTIQKTALLGTARILRKVMEM